MATEHLRMDDAVAKLEDLLNGIRRKNDMLRAALSEGEADERSLANLLIMARNWRFVAGQMNGVDPAHPVE